MRKNLLVSGLAFAFAFFIAEIIFRVKHDYLSYTERTGIGEYTSPFQTANRGKTHAYRPYASQYLDLGEFIDEWKANGDGLKDIDITESASAQRIFILGDSYTEGVGASPDSSYPRILESRLQSNGANVQVINGGLGGSDVFFAYQLLLDLQPKYNADVIILTINSTDISEFFVRGGFERFIGDDLVQYRKGPWYEWLYAKSIFVRKIVHDLFKYDYNFIHRNDYDRHLNNFYHNFELVLDSFNNYAEKHDLGFGVVFHPGVYEVISPDPDKYELRPLFEQCSDLDIPYLDVLSCMNQKGITGLKGRQYYWPLDGHFNTKGYELMAGCVHEFIEREYCFWQLDSAQLQ